MKAFSEALSMGAMDKITVLSFADNQIGDEGMKPFAEALFKGALNNLENLDLRWNHIGNEKMKVKNVCHNGNIKL
eukprot:scaffold218831_cov24-Tisochrysis_lutea.AAC.1